MGRMEAISRRAMADRIAARLDAVEGELRDAWNADGRIPAFVVDDLLPEAWALAIRDSFPDAGGMTLKRSVRELKYVSAQMDAHAPLLEAALFAFQEPEVVARVARITGITELEPDPELYAGGISVMGRGHFLNPHLDNSHDAERRRYRALNLLYYMTPDWRAEDGGALELWDDGPAGEPRAIPCLFNRLIVMATDERSWHSVQPIGADRARCCISNYYFSPRPPSGRDYRHATSFRGRPGERLKSLALAADAFARTTMMRLLSGRGSASRHRYRRPSDPA